MAVPSNSTRAAVSTTRRQLIAAAGGVAAVSALATPAAADEPLVKLWEEYERLTAELDAADAAYWAAYCRRPEAPACICRRGGINPATATPYLVPLEPDELQEEFEQAVEWRGRARAERDFGPRLQAMKEWQAACEASDVRHQVAELSGKVDDLFLRSGAVIEEILNTPPRSARGVVVWLQMMERHMESVPSEPEREWPTDQRVMRRLLPAVRALA